jgi:hypothetical protein
MLSYDEVLKRAITWYVLATYNEGHPNNSTAYSKAHAYIDVLNLPYHKCCGIKCAENLKEYAKGLAYGYKTFEIIHDHNPPIMINEYIRERLDLNFWDNLTNKKV